MADATRRENAASGASGSVPAALEALFMTGGAASWNAYQAAVGEADEQLERHFAGLKRPYSGLEPQELGQLMDHAAEITAEGRPLAEVLDAAGRHVLAHSIAVSHPLCIAHLHCPPLIPALAAEAMIGMTNQSMDSWDQSSTATLVEERLVNWLCREVFGSGGGEADGVFTSGGTQSNLMGLLLARDDYAQRKLGWNIQQLGLPEEARRMRIVCSQAAHFTVQQSAALLGLGHAAVVPVATDESQRLSLAALEETLDRLEREGLLPFAIVATAGTTDFGSIDPLAELAERTRRRGLWLHVDAAYGGALLLSDRHRGMLRGLELADSVTVDFHKLFYQPISCGAFLVKDRAKFELLKLHADYLNPEGDEDDGVPNLVTKSLQTTRRFDALKLLISLQALGTRRFGEIVDYTLDLAAAAATTLRLHPRLELLNEPALNAVVFRYRADRSSVGEAAVQELDNRLNAAIRSELLRSGEAVIARTRVAGQVCMKLTLLNPLTTMTHLEALFNRIDEIGADLEQRELAAAEGGRSYGG
uniref:Aspartate aminotransferase family protein n=2 Tax=Paenibacillus athensensis TaxID=1967502 RepID=A0A4Y8PRR0_9BACL